MRVYIFNQINFYYADVFDVAISCAKFDRGMFCVSIIIFVFIIGSAIFILDFGFYSGYEQFGNSIKSYKENSFVLVHECLNILFRTKQILANNKTLTNLSSTYNLFIVIPRIFPRSIV